MNIILIVSVLVIYGMKNIVWNIFCSGLIEFNVIVISIVNIVEIGIDIKMSNIVFFKVLM